MYNGLVRHHTKDKGDKGLGFVVADLLRNGIQPALLLSEHLPFDCIALNENGNMKRISVKFRTSKNGSVPVGLRSSWSDRHGVHIKLPNLKNFDAIAVYCPDTGKVYYIRTNELNGNKSFLLRLNAPKNGQKRGIRLASMFENALRIFDTHP